MMPRVADPQPISQIRLPSLVIAIAIMLACTLYPPMMAAACSGDSIVRSHECGFCERCGICSADARVALAFLRLDLPCDACSCWLGKVSTLRTGDKRGCSVTKL